ncbi:hypothetical protein CKO_03005 [Citrobacter koseri ATCC BAA-895]|uniref:Uncharacterized protein n=1 Tax=Citrobacter koseri (strain ATCC BAA-895 / CDC 4225-83 / SGSC4696) TaxID=290338 RepID=A8AKU3_CITK8|nr:hypothetical protein CKO_03005 [Citrobacter koseri ATCC BAA-895]
MDDAVFVVTVTNLTSFSVLNRFSNVRRYSTHFRVRHQATRTQNLAQLANNAHCIRGSNNNVKVHFAFLDLFSQIFHTYQFSASSFSSFSVCTLGKYGYANGTASTVRQYSCATYVLVRFTRVDAEVNGNVYAFYELSSGQFFQQRDSFVDVVLFGRINFLTDHTHALGQFSHFLVLHYQAHGTCSTFDGASHRFNVGTSHVGSFGLRDFLQLSAGNFTYFVFVRLAGTRLNTSRFLQQNCCRRRFGNEGERTVSVNGDNNRNRQTFFDGISFCVERFAEFHDVYALLTQSRTYWRTRVSHTSCNLQLDVGLYFLSHCNFLVWV